MADKQQGTIVITGGNGSIATEAVRHLLTHSPTYTLVLAVRNTGPDDKNTSRLRAIIAQHPSRQVSIRALDLADLSAVHNFARTIMTEIASGALPPIAAVVLNAKWWNLAGPMEMTADRYEKSFAVMHLAHAALVMRLLGSFRTGPEPGQVVIMTTDAHAPRRNILEKYPPVLGDDLELLARPHPDPMVDYFNYGFCRDSTAKLAGVTWGHALNRRLEKDSKLSNITAVMIDPGVVYDSRVLQHNTPFWLKTIGQFVNPIMGPVARLMDPKCRTCAESGADMARLATNDALPGERGYFTLLKEDTSTEESLDEAKQDALWAKTAEWVGITA